MKNIRLFTLIITSFIVSGCVMPWADSSESVGEIQGVYWAEYYQTQCNANPWGEDTAENVTSYYETNYDVAVLGVEFIEQEVSNTSCNACGCPTGKTLKVQTSFEDRLTLLELGFVHEGEAPVVIDTTVDAVSNATPNEVNINLSDTAIDSTTTPDIDLDTVVNDATTTIGDEPTEPTPEDITLEEKVTLVQQALANYFSQHKNYPETLNDLGVDLGDTTGLNYTPIGSVPSSYYDLTADYSTGKVTINP